MDIDENFEVVFEEDKGEVIDPPPPDDGEDSNVIRRVRSLDDDKICYMRGRNPQFLEGDVICYRRVTNNGKLYVSAPRNC